jgi:hypothetical protein
MPPLTTLLLGLRRAVAAVGGLAGRPAGSQVKHTFLGSNLSKINGLIFYLLTCLVKAAYLRIQVRKNLTALFY